MARIRSVHPELFTDEGFCSLSPLARLLCIGIWTLCDDRGIFEWKPFGMKIGLLPVDSIDVPTLLAELVEHKQVKPFEIDGKAYGAVRNFCLYQRPKKAVYKHPFPHWCPAYVAFDRRKAAAVETEADTDGAQEERVTDHIHPSVLHQSPTKGGNRPHRSGEKGREGKGEKPQTKIETLERVTPATSEAPPPPASETLSPKDQAAPARKGLAALGSPLPDDWIPDTALCEKVASEFGMTEQDLQREVPAFHAYNVSQGAFSQDWSATFYLFCKRWAEHKAKQPAPRIELQRMPGSERHTPAEADWDRHLGFYARTGRWSSGIGPDPMSAACKAPRHLFEKHGINVETGERTIPPRKAVSA